MSNKIAIGIQLLKHELCLIELLKQMWLLLKKIKK